MWVYVSSAVLLVFIFYIPLPFIWGRAIRICQKKKAISQKTVYLTFDDGPGNRLTPQILKILHEKGIKATFFILSRNIPGREQVLKSVAEEGHRIASHSDSHFNAWKVMPWRSISDIQKGWRVLNAALSAKETTYLYRPPCGKLNLISLLFLGFHRTPVVFWTIDCLDTWPNDKRDVHYAARRIRQDKGGIVLFHDFDRATNALDDYVLESLNAVIGTGLELGLHFSTLDELYKKGNYSK